MSQPAQGECECLHVWVCLCFIPRTPDCCSFPVQRQNKCVKAKMCSSPALTHITALFRPSSWPQIIIQLKQFSASICQIDVIHHSNDTNRVSLFLSPSPSKALSSVSHMATEPSAREENRESQEEWCCICSAGCW